MAQMLPIFLNLDSKPVLVIGGGAVALEKIRKLHAAGAHIEVVATTVASGTADAAAALGVTVVRRPFRDADVQGRVLVISAVNDPETHQAVARAARAAGVLVNTVDEPQAADFYFGAQVQRGPLQMAISTQGVFPGVARAMRQWLEEAFPEAVATELNDLAALRQGLRQRIPDSVARLRALKQQLSAWASTQNVKELSHGIA